MSINRRGFLGALVAPFVAKAVVPSFHGWRLGNMSPVMGVGMRVNAGKLEHSVYFMERTGLVSLRPLENGEITSTPVGYSIHLRTPPRYMVRP